MRRQTVLISTALLSVVLLVAACATVPITGRRQLSLIPDNEMNALSFQQYDQVIAESDLKRIFDPGFTTRGVGVGTGLGLATCYQTLRDHRGSIAVDSEPGRGSSFAIVLPL